MVLNKDHQDGKPFTVAAITTAITNPVASNMVELTGDSRAKFNKPCAAVCDWLKTIRPEDVEEVRALLTPTFTHRVIDKVLERHKKN